MIERTTEAQGVTLGAAWGGSLRRGERGFDPHDMGGGRPWQRGPSAVVENLSWEDLIAIGDARLRTGGAAGAGPSAEPAARRVYFAALYRACREESLEGILRAAEAFAELGDGEVVDECLGLAELKADGEDARRRLSILVQRIGVARAGTDRGGRDPHVPTGPTDVVATEEAAP
jgi:hypothetical protein